MRARIATGRLTVILTAVTIALPGSLVFVELEPRGGSGQTTITSISTTTRTVEASHTPTTTATLGSAVMTNASSVSSNGIELATSINTTGISSGQGLNVTLSLTNTLSTVNTVPTSDDWTFPGIPAQLWPACYGTLPVSAAILNGNYTADEVQIFTSSFVSSYICHGGGGTPDHVVFGPDSDRANLTGLYCFGACQGESNMTLGPFYLSSSFSTLGYWDFSYLAGQYDWVTLGGSPEFPSLPFVPGVYTVAVEDEWGQVNVLHFQLVPENQTPSMTLEGFSICAEDCAPYPSPLLSGTIYFNSSYPVQYLRAMVNGTWQIPYERGVVPVDGSFDFKETINTPAILPGDDYNVTLFASFGDNSTYTATAFVIAR